MSNPIFPGRLHDAVLALLADELPVTIPVGDSGAPDAGDADVLSPSKGHVVVDLVPSGNALDYPGWTGSNEAMRWVRQQVVGYGVQPNQARWISDKCKQILLGHDDEDGWDNTPVVEGHAIVHRAMANDVPADSGPGLHSAGFLIDWLLAVD